MEFMESLPILKEAAERRERIRQERLEVARAKMREKEEVESKRKKNLERLRNKVRVEVERDPTRTVKNTAAWSERILATKLDRDPINYIQTYTNSQVRHAIIANQNNLDSAHERPAFPFQHDDARR